MKIIALLKQDFHPNLLLPSLAAGLVAGIDAVTLSIAFAALIFSGELAQYFPNGVGMLLFGSIVVGGVMALFSGFRGLVGGPQECAAVMLSLAAASIAGEMSISASGGDVFSTIFVAVALASFLAGAAFWLMGQFKFGNLVRYIPYPVIGGFLAGSGLLLVQGAISVMLAESFTWFDLPRLLQPGLVLKWLPGVVFGVLLVFLLRRYDHFLIMPGSLLAAILVFFAYVGLSGTSLDCVMARGWLLGSGSQAGEIALRFFSLSELARVDWSALVAQLGTLLAVVLVSLLSMLLNTSGIELEYRQDVDLNHELKVTGVSNLLAGLGGGVIGFHVLSDTALAFKMGARSRLVGVFLVAVCGFVLLAGGNLLMYLPNFVMGGLLLFLGADFLVTWLYQAWFKLLHKDYLIVLAITLVINAVGFLEGIGLGLILAVILFAMEYSRIDVVKHTLSGAYLQSSVERPRLYQRLLIQKGDWLYILKLQGFIFFGTANKLLDQVRQRVCAGSQPPRFIVLDFCRVNGLDASAILSFVKIKQLGQAQNIVLVFTRLSLDMQRQLEREVLTKADEASWRVFPDLDHGVEWCEEQLIKIFEEVGLAGQPKSVKRQLEEFLPRSKQVISLLDLIGDEQRDNVLQPSPGCLPVAGMEKYMECLSVEAGHVLIQQGQPVHSLYFVETGQVKVWLDGQDGKDGMRLRKAGAGTIVGEMGLYLGVPASASVVAEQPSTVYSLSVDSLKRMEQDDPEIAAAFHKFIAQLLSERLRSATGALQALSD